MKEFLQKYLRFDLIMLIWLVALFIYYGFDALLNLQPQSVHHWRQSDCASFAWNYYITTWNFFEPHFNNLGWRGDGEAALEFPIIYYVVGMLWRVAGPHPWIFRLVNILIVFAGLWAYARMVRLLIKDNFWPIFVSGLLFTSPVMVYYTVNFLPDVPAIAVGFIGWYCLLLYSEHGRHRSFVWAMVWFTLAALLKAPAGLGLMSAFALYFIEGNGWFRFRGEKGLFPGKPLRLLPYFIGGFVLVFSWYLYATWYTTHFETQHFSGLYEQYNLLRSHPNDLLMVLHTLVVGNLQDYYYPYTHFLVIFLLFFCFSVVGRKQPLLFAINLLTFMGCVAYLFLFFKLFVVHDYYALPLLLVPAWLFVQAAVMVREYFPVLHASNVFKALLLIGLCFNIYHAKMRMQRRYYDHPLHVQNRQKDVFYDPGLRPFLASIGVTEDKKVVSMPDVSPNITLYLMGRKGWSVSDPARAGGAIQHFRSLGAEYFILHEEAMVADTNLRPLMTDSIGSYMGLHVYRFQ